jgi:hypothetical protein
LYAARASLVGGRTSRAWKPDRVTPILPLVQAALVDAEPAGGLGDAALLLGDHRNGLEVELHRVRHALGRHRCFPWSRKNSAFPLSTIPGEGQSWRTTGRAISGRRSRRCEETPTRSSTGRRAPARNAMRSSGSGGVGRRSPRHRRFDATADRTASVRHRPHDSQTAKSRLLTLINGRPEKQKKWDNITGYVYQ